MTQPNSLNHLILPVFLIFFLPEQNSLAQIWHLYLQDSVPSEGSEEYSELSRVYQQTSYRADVAIALGQNIPQEVFDLFEMLFGKLYQQYKLHGREEALDMLWKISEYDKSRKLLAHINRQSEFKNLKSERPTSKEKALKPEPENSLENENQSGAIFPGFNAVIHSLSVATISQVQSSLDQDQAVLEYYLGDYSFYVTLITADLVKVQKLKMEPSFYINMEIFQSALKSADPIDQSENYLSSAHALYNSTIAPVEEFIIGKRLNIVASSELSLIPFEALLTKPIEKQEITNFKSFPFLIKKHSVSYANSMTLLLNDLNKPNIKSNGRILAYSPTFQATREQSDQIGIRNSISPLKWTSHEVRQIADNFPSDVFSKINATEEQFKSIANDYAVIHIASHGILNKANPMLSKIALSKDDSDSINDGYLHTYELFDTSLNAEMAVLSACNTGYGKVQRGEGVVSLAQGFMYAGVKSTVMSLWPANDESTSKIMVGFYKHLHRGIPKDQALQLAKLEFLERSDNIRSHPFYWAQFIVNGNMRPITLSEPAHHWYSWLALIFSVFLFAGYKLRSIVLK